jgi:hypothetical protein
MRLLALGALSAAMLPLTGCMFWGMGRDMLALSLLREKYDRKFNIVMRTYYYNTSSTPEVYCSAENEDDLVFSLEFSILDREIVRDTYVGRKLGRQVENIVTECLEEQGINSVSHSVVDTNYLGDKQENEYNPDISLNNFIDKYSDLKFLTSIIITDQVDDPRNSPQFAEVMTLVYESLSYPISRVMVFVVDSNELELCGEYFFTLPEFYSVSTIPGVKFIDSFLYKVTDSGIEVD